jgi:hypothetical protein
MLPVPVTTVQLGGSLAGNESSLATSTQSLSRDDTFCARKAAFDDRTTLSTVSGDLHPFGPFDAMGIVVISVMRSAHYQFDSWSPSIVLRAPVHN